MKTTNIDTQTASETDKKSGTKVAPSRTSAAYWTSRLTKRANVYRCRIGFSGERHLITLTQDRNGSAAMAAKIYSRLLAEGWPAVLTDHSRIDRTEPSDKAPATVGAVIEIAERVSLVRPATFRSYAVALRLIASEIASTEKSKSRYSTKGAKAWRGTVDEILLADLTAARLVEWQKGRIEAAGEDKRRRRSAMVSANSILRQARSLIGRKILPHLREALDLPGEIALASVPLIPLKAVRYVSRLDAELVLRRAMAELPPEPLKIVLLALCAGLRAGEIDGLRWSGVDLDAGAILIDSTETFETKSADSVGTVEIDAGLVELLRGWKAARSGAYVVAADAKPRGWPGERRAKAAFDEVYGWLRDLEIDGEKPLKDSVMPLHTLRKEAGSLVNQRHGLAAASIFLRHASIGITAQTYVGKKERVTVGLLATPPDNVIDLDARKEAANG